MSTIASENFMDHDTGSRVKDIIEKYLGTTLTETTCDLVMADLRASFGENISAQVLVDTDINDIEVIIRDKNNRFMKCSALTLFPANN